MGVRFGERVYLFKYYCFIIFCCVMVLSFCSSKKYIPFDTELNPSMVKLFCPCNSCTFLLYIVWPAAFTIRKVAASFLSEGTCTCTKETNGLGVTVTLESCLLLTETVAE